jgi:hypothetical protein
MLKMPAALLSDYALDVTKPITKVDELRKHLVNAAAVELSTVPLYLYAAYSIKTSGYSQWSPGISAFRAIRSVVIEEMLHLCLARNMLVAIGGDVRFYDEGFVFKYPGPMLHHLPPLELRLEPASTDLMRRVFMPLEHPMKTDAPPEPGWYHTLGQFYAAIEEGFEYLTDHDETLWSNPRTELQYGRAYWNDDGGGAPILVTGLTSARLAIRTIVEQGEGESPSVLLGDTEPEDEWVPVDFVEPTPGLDELSHFAKFSRIADEIDRIGEVWPVPINPRRGDFDGPVRELATLFDAAYGYLLAMIDTLYDTPTELQEGRAGMTSDRYGIERSFIAAMGGLLYPIAELLVRQPVPAPPGTKELHAAPCFGFYEFAATSTKKDQLIDLCDAVLGAYPSLGGDDGVRQLIGRLPDVEGGPL